MEEISIVSTRAAFPRAPHMSYGGAAVWFTSPPGAVVQLLEPVRGTLELVNWLVGPAYDELERRFPGRQALIFVFDLELMTGRSAASRSVFLAKVRECGKRFAEGLVVPPTAANAAYRQSMYAAMAIARAVGIHVEMVSSSVSAVASRSLKPAL
jgi:hypothetical protein